MDTETLNANIPALKPALERLMPLVEGLIFTAGEDGLSLLQIQSVFEECTRDELGQVLELLRRQYQLQSRGIELVRYGGRWKFVAKEVVFPYASRLYARTSTSSLSPAAMEVLSLIAYNQPITRVEIDEIRGVSSEVMLKKLQARDLIETCGNRDTIGRPLLWQVSSAFYDAFGLESLADLPECETPEVITDLFEQAASDTKTNPEPSSASDPLHTPVPPSQTSSALQTQAELAAENPSAPSPDHREQNPSPADLAASRLEAPILEAQIVSVQTVEEDKPADETS